MLAQWKTIDDDDDVTSLLNLSILSSKSLPINLKTCKEDDDDDDKTTERSLSSSSQWKLYSFLIKKRKFLELSLPNKLTPSQKLYSLINLLRLTFQIFIMLTQPFISTLSPRWIYVGICEMGKDKYTTFTTHE